MTEQDLLNLVNYWDLSAPVEDYSLEDEIVAPPAFVSLHSKLCWFGQNLWANYLPAQHHGCNPSYAARLAEWVGNSQDEKQRKMLLAYADLITFLTHDDITALQRAAFNGPITRWIIDQNGLKMTDSNFESSIIKELYNHTWYCPITDSMDINEFYHVNHLKGISHRPAFATLAMLGDQASSEVKQLLAQKLRQFIQNPDPRANLPPLKRLVLLEDFVGSGTQAKKSVAWTVEALGIPVLFVPLMICPQGLTCFEELAAKYPGKLFLKPLLTLSEKDLLGPARNLTQGMKIAEEVEQFATDTFEKVAGGPHTNRRKEPYTPFGWEETGCSLVTYSNTPNNTPPIVHHQPPGGQWKPLFPRSARV